MPNFDKDFMLDVIDLNVGSTGEMADGSDVTLIREHLRGVKSGTATYEIVFECAGKTYRSHYSVSADADSGWGPTPWEFDAPVVEEVFPVRVPVVHYFSKTELESNGQTA